VIEHVSLGEPQHRAFLMMTKALGLIQSEDGTNLLVAAPNAFAKDVLESRLRIVVNEVLTRELGAKTNIAVMIDETIELADLPAPTVVVENTSVATAPKTLGRDASGSPRSEESSQLNPRYIFETFVIGSTNRFAHAAAVAVAEAPAKAITRYLSTVILVLVRPTYCTLLAHTPKSYTAMSACVTSLQKSSQMTLLTQSVTIKHLPSNADIVI
jgi:chromosomal replication initiation ATPase DnaA